MCIHSLASSPIARGCASLPAGPGLQPLPQTHPCSRHFPPPRPPGGCKPFPSCPPFALKAPLHLPPSSLPGTPGPRRPQSRQAPAWAQTARFPATPDSAAGQLHAPQCTAFPTSWEYVLESQSGLLQHLPSACSASWARGEPFRRPPPGAGWVCSSDSEEGPRSSPHTYVGPSTGPYGRQSRNLAQISPGNRVQKANMGQNSLERLPTLTPPSGLGVIVNPHETIPPPPLMVLLGSGPGGD